MTEFRFVDEQSLQDANKHKYSFIDPLSEMNQMQKFLCSWATSRTERVQVHKNTEVIEQNGLQMWKFWGFLGNRDTKRKAIDSEKKSVKVKFNRRGICCSWRKHKVSTNPLLTPAHSLHHYSTIPQTRKQKCCVVDGRTDHKNWHVLPQNPPFLKHSTNSLQSKTKEASCKTSLDLNPEPNPSEKTLLILMVFSWIHVYLQHFIFHKICQCIIINYINKLFSYSYSVIFTCSWLKKSIIVLPVTLFLHNMRIL